MISFGLTSFRAIEGALLQDIASEANDNGFYEDEFVDLREIPWEPIAAILRGQYGHHLWRLYDKLKDKKLGSIRVLWIKRITLKWNITWPAFRLIAGPRHDQDKDEPDSDACQWE